ncbi:MopE-related protein, partial [Aestuariivivens sediminis]|uniref:MopE-related protein n=1 Tax=Aestuariivivens sediminis TaxID=2913557 RepID=UPI001F560134
LNHYIASELTATTGDCNDNDAAIHPGATEVCDGIDNNCNGQTDEGVKTTYYADSDGDGYGNPASTTQACSPPSGYVSNNTDCDDTDANVNPGETEILDNGKDDDCNPSTLDSSADVDDDGDGFTENEGDCDDTNPDINPNAIEICDGKDNDCDGQTDEGVTTTYYADNDGDNYGDLSSPTQACSLPPGYVLNNTDCDDTDNTVYPGAPELCDGKDNDCANGVDDGVVFQDYYTDADGDGYGDAGDVPESSCSAVSGKVTNNLDCDDTDDTIYSGAQELCDGKDNDCNGQTDEGVTTTYYADNDGDNYGDPASTTQACSPPSGYVSNNTDCDDTDNTVYPGAPELCDGKDNDCANGVDDGLLFEDYYTDADGDGYGDAGDVPEKSCSAVSGKVTNNLDCDDTDDTIYSGAQELCDGKDNDCNGQTDEGVKTTYYADSDGDGYGDPASTTQACSPPSGYVSNNTDCDDTDNTIYPGAPELCDGKDNDCDSQVDEGFTDTDSDGIADCIDNCPTVDNSDQSDVDNDGIGDACEGLAVESLTLKDITIFPNPFNSDITIQLPPRFNSTLFTLTLFDITGKRITVREKTVIHGKIELGYLATLDQGLYLLKLTSSESGSLIKRLVKF